MASNQFILRKRNGVNGSTKLTRAKHLPYALHTVCIRFAALVLRGKLEKLTQVRGILNREELKPEPTRHSLSRLAKLRIHFPIVNKVRSVTYFEK